MNRTALAGSALFLAACATDVQDELPITLGDPTTYASDVHPVLEPACATLDCHGDPGRPLRLYAATGLRLDDALRRMDVPVTDEELERNVEALIAVDPSPISLDAHVALTKPLAVRAGGLHHVGEDPWPSRDDPAYRCLRAWLDGGRDPAACADAAARYPRP